MSLRFSNTWHIVTMGAAWLFVLLGADYAMHRRLPWPFVRTAVGSRSVGMERPHVRLSMNHLCCSGCLDDVRASLRPLRWLGEPQLASNSPLATQQEARFSDDKSYANDLDIPLSDLGRVDFVALHRTLQDTGLSTEAMEIGGVTRFRLEVQLRHLCCQVCTRAVEQGVTMAQKLRGAGGLRWVREVQVSHERKTLLIEVGDSNRVDVMALIRALDHLGFAPLAVRLVLLDRSVTGTAPAPVAPAPVAPAPVAPAAPAAPVVSDDTPPTAAAPADCQGADASRVSSCKAALNEAAAPTQRRLALSRPIRFVAGEARLVEDGAGAVRALAAVLAADPALRRVVLDIPASGYPEVAGKLSAERAVVLQAALRTAGVPRSLLRLRAHRDLGGDALHHVMLHRNSR